MIYDLIINVHPKDLNKIPYCISSIYDNFSILPENNYIVTPEYFYYSSFKTILDNEAIAINKNEIKHKRPNWIFQQLIKLFQNFTKNNLYMCVDADIIFNNKINVGKKFYISSREQYHEPYFNLMKKIGIKRCVNHTFINDFMLFDKNICKEVVGGDIKSFVDFLNEAMNDSCYLSEFELYGNYVMNKYPKLYDIEYTQVATFGKYIEQYGNWTNQEINTCINIIKNVKDVDILAIHSWT